MGTTITTTTTTKPTTTVSPSKATSITTSASTTRSVEEERPVEVVEDDEFSLEYVNTVLEDKVPHLKVLQCWSRFNICFIQIGESDPLRNMLEITAETP